MFVIKFNEVCIRIGVFDVILESSWLVFDVKHCRVVILIKKLGQNFILDTFVIAIKADVKVRIFFDTIYFLCKMFPILILIIIRCF